MYICENCKKECNTPYGSGRFCSQKCARSFSTKKDDKSETKAGDCIYCGKTYQINKRRSEKTFICDECKITRKKEVALEKEKALRIFYSKLAKDIDIENSPYKEYDTVCHCKCFGDEGYYFTKHNESGKIIKRTAVPVYRYLVEKSLNRLLKYNEVVHHKDMNHTNNDINNLIVMDRAEHTRLHNKLGN